jgi:predicted nucleotidyltransferase
LHGRELIMTIIYKVISGSHAYGTATKDSDTDLRGVFIPDNDYVFGIKRMDHMLSTDGEDSQYYDLRKYIALLVDSNPNILELLYVDEVNILEIDLLGKMLRDSREIFLSKRVFHTFGAYAHSQMKRMESHVKWIENPPSPPDPESFGGIFTDGAFRWPNTHLERNYEAALRNYSNYTVWKTNRNEKRSKLEEKHGYDTKHAMHTFRLLRMGKEILLTGFLTVLRPDKDFLLEILNGKYSYENIKTMSDTEFVELESALNSSSLPSKVNYNAANNLCVEIMRKHYGI